MNSEQDEVNYAGHKHIHVIKVPFQIPIAPGKTVDRFVYAYLIYGKNICLIDTGIASSKQSILII